MDKNEIYPINIIKDVFETDEGINIDEFDESLKFILENGKFKEREIEIINKRYKQGETLAEIGNGYGVTRERIRMIISKCLFRLKREENSRILRYGLEGIKKVDEKNADVLSRYTDSIESLGFSNRTYRHLKLNGVNTVGQLAALSNDDILSIRSLGKKSQIEIINKLNDGGYKRHSRNINQDLYQIMKTYNISKEQLIEKVKSL